MSFIKINNPNFTFEEIKTNTFCIKKECQEKASSLYKEVYDSIKSNDNTNNKSIDEEILEFSIFVKACENLFNKFEIKYKKLSSDFRLQYFEKFIRFISKQILFLINIYIFEHWEHDESSLNFIAFKISDSIEPYIITGYNKNHKSVIFPDNFKKVQDYLSKTSEFRAHTQIFQTRDPFTSFVLNRMDVFENKIKKMKYNPNASLLWECMGKCISLFHSRTDVDFIELFVKNYVEFMHQNNYKNEEFRKDKRQLDFVLEQLTNYLVRVDYHEPFTHKCFFERTKLIERLNETIQNHNFIYNSK